MWMSGSGEGVGSSVPGAMGFPVRGMRRGVDLGGQRPRFGRGGRARERAGPPEPGGRWSRVKRGLW